MATSDKYTYLVLQKYALIFLIAGAINWLFVGLFGMNLLEEIFGRGSVTRLLYSLVGLSALFLMFKRDFYLPFLGETVMPCAGLEDRKPSGADTSVTVKTAPYAKVLYWAAEPETEELQHINDWKKAYQAFENVGVTTATESGEATLAVRKPQAYTVPFKGRLEPHIHYRICEEGGMMGAVRTVFIGAASDAELRFQNSLEGFTNPADSKKGFHMQTQLDPEKLISNLTKALPQVQQAMTALNNQFAMDASHEIGSSESSDALGGQSITEAFRSY
jgi:uncharacterized membrane protein YuzA (DUF378 family)